MPKSKSQFTRFKTLDRCFRNTGRSYDIDALIRECGKYLFEYLAIGSGVSRSRIYDDVKHIESEVGCGIELVI